MLLPSLALLAVGLSSSAFTAFASPTSHDQRNASYSPLTDQLGYPYDDPGIGQGGSSTAGWVSWLSGMGWGEGTLKFLDPKTVLVEDATFATRSASFTPRLGAVVPSMPDSDRSADNITNPFYGSLVPITSFALPETLPAGWNATLEMQACSAADKRAKRSPSAFASDAPALSTALPRVALALRGGGCAFAAKVRLAQALGAHAVVIGDEALYGESEAAQRQRQNLITMFSPDETDDLRIPALFVSRATYLAILDELDASAAGAIDVRLEQDTEWEYPLLDLLLLLLLLPSLLTIATLGLHHLRVARRRKRERATPDAIDALEVRIWEEDGWEKDDGASSHSGSSDAGSSSSSNSETASRRSGSHNAARAGQEASCSNPSSSLAVPRMVNLRPKAYYNTQECAICLELFKKGDPVRILPCGHIYHRDEVDQWLKGWKKVCPVCKADITRPFPSRRKRRQLPAQISESTPLLGPMPQAQPRSQDPEAATALSPTSSRLAGP